MSCCPNDITTFEDESETTTIPYTGDTPIVSVYYLIDGSYQQAGIMTQIQITPTDIIVNHGGPATGYVKVL